MPFSFRHARRRGRNTLGRVGCTAALAALLAAGCSSNPPTQSTDDTAAEQSADEGSAAGALALGTAGAAVGAVGGAVGGALYASGACAQAIGIFGIICAPVGAVVGGVYGAVTLGAKGAKAGAEMGRQPAAASTSDAAEEPEGTQGAQNAELEAPAESVPQHVEDHASAGKTEDSTHDSAQDAQRLHAGSSAMVSVQETIKPQPELAQDPAISRQPPAASESTPVASIGSGMATSTVSRHSGLPAVGTSWTYRFTDLIYARARMPFTVKVVRISDEVVAQDVMAGAAAMRDTGTLYLIESRQTRFQEMRIGANVVVVEFAPYLLAAGGEDALRAGGDAVGYPDAGISAWITRSSPVVWEQVTVPAGTFRSARLEIEGRRAHDSFILGHAGRFKITAWYVPEVRRLVRLEHEVWSGNTLSRRMVEHDLVELLAYRPPS